MAVIHTIERSFETPLGTSILLLITKSKDHTNDKKSPLSVNISFSTPESQASNMLITTIYGVPYKHTEALTTVLLDTSEDKVKDFALTTCKILVKRFKLPCYVSISSSSSEPWDFSENINIIEVCIKNICL